MTQGAAQVSREDPLTLQPVLSSTPRHVDVIAVIPAFNEERFIASVVLNTLQYVHHVIVVDDGSSDRTSTLAEQAGAQVIRQPCNMGKAQALNAGFRAALKHHPKAVVCLDGDAQHDSADLHDVVRPILDEGIDVVIGSRFLGIGNTAPGWRQVGQNALTHVTNLTSGVQLTDSQSGFRAFSPNALRVLHFDTPGLSVESEMQFLLAQTALSVKEVPIHVRYMDGNKRNPLIHGLQVIDAILSLVAHRRPLLFFSLPGALVATLGLILGFSVWLAAQAPGELRMGLVVLTSLLMIGGLLLALTGLLLHSMQHMASYIAGQVNHVLRQTAERR